MERSMRVESIQIFLFEVFSFRHHARGKPIMETIEPAITIGSGFAVQLTTMKRVSVKGNQLARTQPDSFAPSGRCGLLPFDLDRFGRLIKLL